MVASKSMILLAWSAMLECVAGGTCAVMPDVTPEEHSLKGLTNMKVKFVGYNNPVIKTKITPGKYSSEKIRIVGYSHAPTVAILDGQLVITAASVCPAAGSADTGHLIDCPCSGEDHCPCDPKDAPAPPPSSYPANMHAPSSGDQEVSKAGGHSLAACALLGTLAFTKDSYRTVAVGLAAAIMASTATGMATPACEPHIEVEIYSPRSTPAWHATFPPKGTDGVLAGVGGPSSNAIAAWFKDNVATIKKAAPMTLTAKQLTMVKYSAAEFMAARKAGTVTCVEYATALTERATYYKYMNQFMYWDNMPNQMKVILDMAKALDDKAAASGIESIAPLYCLPIPIKGTMATKDFPSSAGMGILHDYYALDDCAAVKHVKAMNGIPFGKTTVPEFAASWVSCNYANGCALNPYGHKYTSGGSSGGSGSAVATYIAPVAFTEDTGGSTRHPSAQNHNFGYDPTRNHYPNAGNPGMSYTNDQIGINARSIEDVIAFDGAFLDIAADHAAAAASSPALSAIKVGYPQYPFVEVYIPAGGFSAYGLPASPSKYVVSDNVMAKYLAVKAALSGAVTIDQEWPTVNGVNAVADVMNFKKVNGMDLDVMVTTFHSYSGQVAEWMRGFLDAPIGVNEIVKDIYTAGNGHGPAAFVTTSGVTDETQFRYLLGPYIKESIDAWNSYFDTTGADVIMTPASYCDALTYECQANGSCKMSDGTKEISNTLLHCNIVSYLYFKNIPIPKVTFPVGLDADGNHVSMEFWGRSGPKDATDTMWVYNDTYAKTADVDFLAMVKTLVNQIYTVADLQRVDAPGLF